VSSRHGVAHAGSTAHAARGTPACTVGVSGCGQRSTYLVVCAEGGNGCIAAGSRNVVR